MQHINLWDRQIIVIRIMGCWISFIIHHPWGVTSTTYKTQKLTVIQLLTDNMASHHSVLTNTPFQPTLSSFNLVSSPSQLLPLRI
jgi:hypothetical protein